MTFKPAIKTKNVKSLILKAPPGPSRGRQLVDAYNPPGGNLISLISQTEHVRNLATAAPPRAVPKSACSGMYIVSDYSKIPDLHTLNFKIHSSVSLILFVDIRKWTGVRTLARVVR